METTILNRVQELYNLGFIKGEISLQLGHGKEWTRQRLQELGLDGHNPNRHLITHQYFSPSIRQKSILIGTMMGDGHLVLRSKSIKLHHRRGSKRIKHARLMLVHGTAQESYLRWKVDQFGSLFGSGPKRREFYDKRTDSIHVGWYCSSRSHCWLTEWHSKFYPEGKKVVTEEILSHIDDLALAVWWCDDGGTPRANRGRPHLGFYLGNLTSSEYELIYAWFSSQGFDPMVNPQNGNCILFTLNRVDSMKLRERIAPFIPESMLYKFNRYLRVN